MALGAVQRDILAMLLREGLVLLWIGVLVGGTLAWAAARLMGSLLAGVSPHDPVALLVAALILGAAGLLASYVPARKATKVDPMVALRHE